MTIRVRFAPSPTGQLHVGGLRTALYNFLFARQQGGKFLLRIEDTDRKRFVEGAMESLIESMRWAGLDFDEGPGKEGDCGPYIQSERLALYQEAAQTLLDAGHAYYAFDTSEELKAAREAKEAQIKAAREAGEKPTITFMGYDRAHMKNSVALSPEEVQALRDAGVPAVVRLKVPEGDRTYIVDDLIRGRVEFGADQIDDQVLLKADGFPTYHLACVVDDHHMGITHVIRGEEWLPSTPKHLLLYEVFGWQAPKMAHLPLLLNADGSKMSKRKKIKGEHVEVNVEDYRAQHYFPEALVNFLALLGWNPGDDRERFDIPALIEHFSLERVNKSGAVFDLDKLRWLNRQVLSEMPAAQLATHARPHLEDAGFSIPSEAYLQQVVDLMRDRMQFISDLVQGGDYFFQDPQTFDKKARKKRWKPQSPDLVTAYAARLEELDAFNQESAEATLRSLVEEHEVGAGQLIHPTRLAISGQGGGPGLFEMMEVLGKETCVRRLQYAAQNL